jgi:AAA15 family ATPase/GTPase
MDGNLLIQFRVENHRSLRDEQTLSLVASTTKADHGSIRVDGFSEELLPVVAIYGANASGKSNVLAALDFMRRAVIDSQRRWEPLEPTPREPFLLSDKRKQASLYEAEILVSGIRYRYGFTLSAARVEEEWLYSWPRGKKAVLFTRDGTKFDFGKSLHGENEAIRELTRDNSLFLSAAAQNNHAALAPIFRCFADWRFAVRRQGVRQRLFLESLARRLVMDREQSGLDKADIVRLLRDADTGIVDLRVDEIDDTRVDSERPVRRASLSFRHRSDNEEYGWLPLGAESAGTIALLELAPRILDVLNGGGLLCVDELESSLHPALALNVLRLFNKPSPRGRRAQLIFATHDTNLLGTLMGEPALRRDQIWFTEKDPQGATHLYPLTDFHPRKEENLERGYLQGRYGAIPFFGDLSSKRFQVED